MENYQKIVTISKSHIKSQKVREKRKKYFWSKKMSHFFLAAKNMSKIGQNWSKKGKLLKRVEKC